MRTPPEETYENIGREKKERNTTTRRVICLAEPVGGPGTVPQRSAMQRTKTKQTKPKHSSIQSNPEKVHP